MNTSHNNKAKAILCLWIAFVCMTAISCQKKKQEMPEDTLVRVGSVYLTRTDLNQAMPGGLASEDSVKYARAYIKAWINSQAISQLASKEIYMGDIDKMVDQYRNDLIMVEYSRRMYDSHNNSAFSEDTLLNYYESHKEEFLLSRPMVKGVYIKLEDDAKSLPSIRKLYKSDKPTDIDQLDKEASMTAIHYDFFRDKWVDWEQIESRIPYDFGSSADAFLRSKTNLEVEQGGFVYFLDINEMLPTGSVMPFEAARSIIIDRLNFTNRLLYDEKLKKDLIQDATDKGKISILCEL